MLYPNRISYLTELCGLFPPPYSSDEAKTIASYKIYPEKWKLPSYEARKIWNSIYSGVYPTLYSFTYFILFGATFFFCFFVSFTRLFLLSLNSYLLMGLRLQMCSVFGGKKTFVEKKYSIVWRNVLCKYLLAWYSSLWIVLSCSWHWIVFFLWEVNVVVKFWDGLDN